MSELKPSKIIEYMSSRPSPIREIMKMADPANIRKMGLNPKDLISFGGGWVNHRAPEGLRQKYIEVCSDPDKFHRLGGYSPTPGEPDCRKALAEFESKIFGMKDVSQENIIIGQSSTQLTSDMFKTLLNPGDHVIMFDPTYANYFGQLFFTIPDTKIEVEPSGMKRVVPTIEILWIKAMSTGDWRYLPSPKRTMDELKKQIDIHDPRLLLFSSPDNPTGQIPSNDFFKDILKLCQDEGIYVAVDFAYKTQYFGDMPDYYSYSPEKHPNLIGLNSNSKWGRGLGRRLGWMTASKEIIKGMERTQQCSILCPDSIHQAALTSFLGEAIPDGSLRKYLNDAREAYKNAASVTTKAIDQHLGMRRLVPRGGLYTVMDVGSPSDQFVQDVMKNTTVLFVPGTGFGSTLQNAVRLSYGPLVNDTEKIKEGLERVGRYLKKRT